MTCILERSLSILSPYETAQRHLKKDSHALAFFGLFIYHIFLLNSILAADWVKSLHTSLGWGPESPPQPPQELYKQRAFHRSTGELLAGFKHDLGRSSFS